MIYGRTSTWTAQLRSFDLTEICFNLHSPKHVDKHRSLQNLHKVPIPQAESLNPNTMLKHSQFHQQQRTQQPQDYALNLGLNECSINLPFLNNSYFLAEVPFKPTMRQITLYSWSLDLYLNIRFLQQLNFEIQEPSTLWNPTVDSHWGNAFSRSTPTSRTVNSLLKAQRTLVEKRVRFDQLIYNLCPFRLDANSGATVRSKSSV
jgi:hypothetical protein